MNMVKIQRARQFALKTLLISVFLPFNPRVNMTKYIVGVLISNSFLILQERLLRLLKMAYKVFDSFRILCHIFFVKKHDFSGTCVFTQIPVVIFFDTEILLELADLLQKYYQLLPYSRALLKSH